MIDFVWTDKHTEAAKRIMKHSTWGVISPPDMLRAVKDIYDRGGIISKEEYIKLSNIYGGNRNDNFQSALIQLYMVRANEDNSYEFTKVGENRGFYSGNELARRIDDVGLINRQTLDILGHNFLLYARESLPLCCQLMQPGIPKNYLEHEYVDQYVFNQKLNKFKFDNLIRILISFDIIEENPHFGLVIKHAPPALTFYHMACSYFFLSSNKIGNEVDAKDLEREVHSLLKVLNDDYTVLGFNKHPIEGWGKRLAWITPESFEQLLDVGLIDPLTIARILKTILRNDQNLSQSLARTVLVQLKQLILDDITTFRGEPINLTEVLQEFEIS